MRTLISWHGRPRRGRCRRNVALCVNPDENYCKVKAADGYTYYMAEALLDKVLGKLGNEEEGVKAYEILETIQGYRI